MDLRPLRLSEYTASSGESAPRNVPSSSYFAVKKLQHDEGLTKTCTWLEKLEKAKSAQKHEKIIKHFSLENYFLKFSENYLKRRCSRDEKQE